MRIATHKQVSDMLVSFNSDPRSAISNEVAPGLFMAVPAFAGFAGVDLEGALYDVEMILDMTGEGIRPTSVKVTAQEGSPPVTGTTLRALRVWDLARTAIPEGLSQGVRTEQADGSFVTQFNPVYGDLSDEEVARLRKQGPTDETLGWVAYSYNLAGILGLPPARQVEVDLGVPRTTASKWVRRAKEKGLIDGEH
jgi:hypothetical protein